MREKRRGAPIHISGHTTAWTEQLGSFANE